MGLHSGESGSFHVPMLNYRYANLDTEIISTIVPQFFVFCRKHERNDPLFQNALPLPATRSGTANNKETETRMCRPMAKGGKKHPYQLPSDVFHRTSGHQDATT